MAKNFKDIGDALINNANLSRLDLQISRPDYLEKGISGFIEVMTEDKVQEIAEEPEISNFRKEKKRQTTIWKEKKDA